MPASALGSELIGRLRPSLRVSRGPAGVEAGDGWVRFAGRSGGSAAWTFVDFRMGAAPEDAKSNDRRLRESARRAGIRKGAATCVFASPRMDIFPVHLEAVGEDGLESRVVESARRHIGDRIADSVLDFAPLPDSVRRPGENTTVALVFAANRELVSGLLERLETIGVEAERLLTPACVLAPRVVASEPGTRNLVIATTEESTSVSVVQDGHVLLERVLAWGTVSLVARLRSELELDEAKCRRLLTGGVKEALAADGEEGEGDLDDDMDPSGDDPLTGALERVLEPDFLELAREAGGCIGYCNSFFRSAPPVSAIIVGPLASCEPLVTLLERRLGLPMLDASDGLDIPGLEREDAPGAFAVAAASALWSAGVRR